MLFGRAKLIIWLFRKLIELELLERMAGEVLTSLIHKRIETHVQDTCKGSFDTSHISSLENVSRSSVYTIQGS